MAPKDPLSISEERDAEVILMPLPRTGGEQGESSTLPALKIRLVSFN